MSVKPALIVSVFFVMITMIGCEGDKEQFSGLSKMVAKRQQARKALSRDGGEDGVAGGQGTVANAESNKTEKKLSSGILFEKKIEILDAQSKMPLAEGLAYLDKQGRIVRIKITKN